MHPLRSAVFVGFFLLFSVSNGTAFSPAVPFGYRVELGEFVFVMFPVGCTDKSTEAVMSYGDFEAIRAARGRLAEIHRIPSARPENDDFPLYGTCEYWTLVDSPKVIEISNDTVRVKMPHYVTAYDRRIKDGSAGDYMASGLYRNDGSTTPLWTVDWYAFEDSIIVSQDGEHLVRTGDWSGVEYIAIEFYRKGKLIKRQIDSVLLARRKNDLTSDEPFYLSGAVQLNEQFKTIVAKSGEGEIFGFDLTSGELFAYAAPKKSKRHTMTIVRRDGTSIDLDGLHTCGGLMLESSGATTGDDAVARFYGMSPDHIEWRTLGDKTIPVRYQPPPDFGYSSLAFEDIQEAHPSPDFVVWIGPHNISWDSRAWIVKMTDGEQHTLVIDTKGLAYCGWTPGERATVLRHRDIAEISVPRSTKHTVFNLSRAAIFHAAFDPTGTRIVAIATDGQIYTLDATGGDERVARKSGVVTIDRGAFYAPGERIVTTSESGTATIWDATSGSELTILRGHEQTLIDVDFDTGGTRVVTASQDGTARVWDTASGQELAVLRGHRSGVMHAEFDNSGSRVLTASDDKTARIWDASSGEQLAVLRGHRNALTHAAFDRTASRVVTSSADGTVRVWDAENGDELMILGVHGRVVRHAEFDPSGRRILALFYDSAPRVWDASTGERLVTLGGDYDGLWQAAYDASGERLVTISGAGRVQLWEAESGRELDVLRGHEKSVWHAEFDSSGTRVVTAGDDGTVRIWNVPE